MSQICLSSLPENSFKSEKHIVFILLIQRNVKIVIFSIKIQFNRCPIFPEIGEIKQLIITSFFYCDRSILFNNKRSGGILKLLP
jgi:hypothetical protein